MSRGKVVKIDKVMPFSPPGFEKGYTSKMLIDVFNSGSEKMQINHGVLRGGCATPGGVHEGHDEIYIGKGFRGVLAYFKPRKLLAVMLD